MKVYLANSLFSQADQRFNTYLANEIRKAVPTVDLFVPQEQPMNDKESYADSVMIATLDTNHLLQSDVLVAVIDGVGEIDSGVASEIGVFHTTGRPILALYTDSRQNGRHNPRKIEALQNDPTENQFMYRNLYTVGLIKQRGIVIPTVEELLTELQAKAIVSKSTTPSTTEHMIEGRFKW